MKPIRLRTHRGEFTVAADQIAGVKPCMITGPDGQVIEASEILLSIGAVPKPVHVVMRELAMEIEAASRPALVLPISDASLPKLPPKARGL